LDDSWNIYVIDGETVKKLILMVTLFLSQPVLAYDELAGEIDKLEARAAHLSIQSKSLRDTIRKAFSGLKTNKDGTLVGGLNTLLETKALNRDAAGQIIDGADVAYSYAVNLLKEGRSTLGFGSPQQGETASKADRIFSSMQALECVKFEATLIMQNQNLPEALSLGETVSKECEKIVRLMRNDVGAGESAKKKK
jgi:chaperonin cofactor prefoldin